MMLVELKKVWEPVRPDQVDFLLLKPKRVKLKIT